jgi:hypothetical protein
MKIAIMFSGQFRWFDSFKRSFLASFQPALNGHNVQYFAHFWNEDVEEISNFLTLCDPIILELEDKKTNDEVKKFLGFTKNIKGTLPNQTYCIYKVFMLLDQYQKQNNTIFDLYIRMRPDLYFPDQVILNNFDKNILYSKKCHTNATPATFHCDFAYFTRSYEIVKRIAQFGFHLDQAINYPEKMIYKSQNDPEIYCPEELLARYVKNISISTKYHSFDLDLARYRP